MALIRDRWPDGVVRLTSTCADIYRDLLAWHLATEEGGPKWCAQMQGDTDAERLAHAVRGALLAEVQP